MLVTIWEGGAGSRCQPKNVQSRALLATECECNSWPCRSHCRVQNRKQRTPRSWQCSLCHVQDVATYPGIVQLPCGNVPSRNLVYCKWRLSCSAKVIVLSWFGWRAVLGLPAANAYTWCQYDTVTWTILSIQLLWSLWRVAAVAQGLAARVSDAQGASSAVLRLTAV